MWKSFGSKKWGEKIFQNLGLKAEPCLGFFLLGAAASLSTALLNVVFSMVGCSDMTCMLDCGFEDGEV